MNALAYKIEIHRADTVGQHPSCTYRYAEFDEVQSIMQKVLDEEACFSLKNLAINGNDLIAKGLRGKQVGTALQVVLDAVMDGVIPNERVKLLDHVGLVMEKHKSGEA